MPDKRPASQSYENLRDRQIAEFAALLPSFVGRLTWPPARLKEERRTRLRALLATAKARSPWHAKRLAHIDPDDFTEDELVTLPTMTKSDLMKNFDEIVTDRSLSLAAAEAHLHGLSSDAYLLNAFHAVTTGGSSGERGVLVYDWNGWITLGLSAVRVFPLMGIEPGNGESCVFIGAAQAGHGSGAFVQSFAPWLLHTFSPFVSLSVTQPISAIIDGLNRTQPTRLFGFPSILRELCFAAQDGGLRIAPTSILVGAEPLSPATRTLIETIFKAPLYNFYGCNEASCLGFSCPSGPGLHLSDDLVIAEPVDGSGLRTPPGIPSTRVLLTNLFNQVTPLIRYELEDSVTPLESRVPCRCGSSFQKIDDVQGRADDSFHYANGTFVHPVAFCALGHEPAIREYQVRQTETGAHILVQAAQSFDPQAMLGEVSNALARLGLETPRITLETVEQIPRTLAGKLRQFVRLPPSGSGCDGRPH